MATFENNAITDSGRVLLSHVQMGAVFTPTKIVMGSGNLPAGTTVRTITAVVAPEQTLLINKKKRSNDATVTIGGKYTNEDVTTGFYFRELALYAKAIYEDGTEVPEVLYSYGNAGSTADYMPAYTTGQPVERQIDLVVYIGNDTEVNLTIESGLQVGGGFIVIEAGEDIPIDERQEDYLYFKVTDSLSISVTPTIAITFDEPEGGTA